MQPLLKKFFVLAVPVVLSLAGCAVGPDYQQPPVEIPKNWKEAAPRDAEGRARWWEIFDNPELNTLEAQALVANQTLKGAVARVEEARSVARISAADFYPTITFDPAASRQDFSANRLLSIPQNNNIGRFASNLFTVPLDLSYEVDVWGRVRRSYEAAKEEAQASAADYQTVLLTLTSDVAQNYFLLRSLDAEIELLKRTVQLRKEALDLVRYRFEGGVANQLELSQAETDLATTQAQAIALEQRRAQLEDALAVLLGKPASEFSMPREPLGVLPPTIPAGLPSDLLERRPDVAQAERLMAASNARIGVAKAAFFPAIQLTGSAGFQSTDLASLFNWESRLWSVGAGLFTPIFEGGRIRANYEATKARYDEAVAQYRQQVLLAFRDVEDALAGIRVLADETQAQARAVTSARKTTELATMRYREGLSNYLEVVDAQRTQLDNERTAVQILGQRFASSVLLVKALGGGWVANGMAQASPDPVSVRPNMLVAQ
ncbi:MAG TPA: efflux transporter outer membrane subunit [Nitrospiraceae bacterium]|jgi:multidrug efflux system outer membrane protein|nr:efflux transporter outer membrane subunit [Nitrospiraceae bacterium]